MSATNIRHILGMAKSHLDLKGAKGPKIELDLLRLVYAVKELRAKGNQAQGYLLVMKKNIAARVESWLDKYQAGDAVIIKALELPSDDQEALEAEKRINRDGMLTGSLGGFVGSQSNADLGRQLGENALREFIMSKEPGVQDLTKDKLPFGISWDFYGSYDLGETMSRSPTRTNEYSWRKT